MTKLKSYLYVFVIVLVLLGGAYYLVTYRNTNSVKDTSVSRLLGDSSYFPNQTFRGDWIFDEDNIWIATRFNLIRYNLVNKDKQIYTEKDGLLPNPVGGLFKRGNEIWVVSPRYGVSILNTQNNKWRYVTTKDGLVDDLNISMRYQNDIVHFTTLKGSSAYDFKKGQWTASVSQESPPPFKLVNHNDFRFLDRDFYEGWYWRIIDRPVGKILKPTLSGIREKDSLERMIDLDAYQAGCINGGHVQNEGPASLHYNNGYLWVGCDQGIIRYNIAFDQAEYIEISKDYPSNILSVYDAKGDDLFVETSLGLGVVNPVVGEWTPFRYNGMPVFAEHLVTTTLWKDDILEYMTITLGDGSQDADPTWWHYNFQDNSLLKIEIPARISQSLEENGARSLIGNYPPSNNWQFIDGQRRRFSISGYGELPQSIKGSIQQSAAIGRFKVTNTWETINASDRTLWDEADLGLENKKEYKRFGLQLSDARNNKLYRLYRNEGLHDVYSALISNKDVVWLIGNSGLLKIDLKASAVE